MSNDNIDWNALSTNPINPTMFATLAANGAFPNIRSPNPPSSWSPPSDVKHPRSPYAHRRPPHKFADSLSHSPPTHAAGPFPGSTPSTSTAASTSTSASSSASTHHATPHIDTALRTLPPSLWMSPTSAAASAFPPRAGGQAQTHSQHFQPYISPTSPYPYDTASPGGSGSASGASGGGGGPPRSPSISDILSDDFFLAHTGSNASASSSSTANAGAKQTSGSIGTANTSPGANGGAGTVLTGSASRSQSHSGSGSVPRSHSMANPAAAAAAVAAAAVSSLPLTFPSPPHSTSSTSSTADADEVAHYAREDPLATQVWKMYARTKASLPHAQRMENLTWRMMALALRRRREEEGRAAGAKGIPPPARAAAAPAGGGGKGGEPGDGDSKAGVKGLLDAGAQR